MGLGLGLTLSWISTPMARSSWRIWLGLGLGLGLALGLGLGLALGLELGFR